ncbi:Surface antigen [Catalinimonas alkaloidigena]|uniref:Surface antigen n=1 Tax=Catalinimonas alkaloidigena TaxID=1075417 RepID=A0A1G9AZ12_9BACT|nr:BamA/TamA family outer membrane protein [Catalinimonas alkaloidigena]SDK32569.1 Surface antigen [Catalinimonas alkaloidigena]
MLTAVLLQSGCATSYYTDDEHYLLTGQKVKGNKKTDAAALEALYRQESTSSFYLFFYYLGDRYFYDSLKVVQKIEKTEAKYDKKLEGVKPGSDKELRLERLRNKKLEKLRTVQEEGNWLMRVVGEPPVFFDSTLASETTTQMKAYIYNQGFFDNNVTWDADSNTRKHTLKVTYRVEENDPHYIRDLNYITDDSSIANIIAANQSSALVQTGDRYQEASLAAERDRLDKLLRNRGYYGFSKNFIFYDVYYNLTDSTGRKMVDINLKINNPPNGKHRVYTYDNVVVDLQANENQYQRDTLTLNGVHYTAPSIDFPAGVLDRKLQFKPGDIYQLDAVVNTQGQLGSMDMFKFVNMNFDTSGTTLVARIATSPLPKYQVTDEVGLLVSQGSGAPGPFANLTFKVRNWFKSYETFELSGRYSIEGQTSSFFREDSVYRAREVGVNASLVFPTLIFPTRLRYTLAKYNPKTRFLIGYTDIKRPEYARQLFRGNLSYIMQLGNNQALTISPIDLNVVRTRQLAESFEQYLINLQRDQGNPLINSFIPYNSIVSSLSASWTYNTSEIGTATKESFYLRVNTELGGLTPGLLDRTSSAEADGTLLGDASYFQFHRTDIDGRYYLPLNKPTTLAGRLHVGIANPWGRFSQTLPYEKFFFVGGGNSVRAWQPRRLGPGSFVERDANGNPTYLYEQPGEILLEGSLELRRELFSVVEGAIFADFGNVWNNNFARVTDSEDQDPEYIAARQEAAQFSFSKFYNEIAVGVGAGLRLDFSFLIVRFDYGIKTFDPARPLGQRFVLDEFQFRRDQGSLQIGIGYPF